MGPPATLDATHGDPAGRRPGRRGVRRRRPMSDAARALRRCGGRLRGHARCSGAGMEGTVAVLDDDRVVKLLGLPRPAPTSTGCGPSTTRSRRPASPWRSRGSSRWPRSTAGGHRAGAAARRAAARPTPSARGRGAGRPRRRRRCTPTWRCCRCPTGSRPSTRTVPFAGSLADLVERRAALLAGHVDARTVARARRRPARSVAARRRHSSTATSGCGNLLVVDGRPTGCSTSATSPPSATRRSTRRWPPRCTDMLGPGDAAATAGSTRLTTERFGYDDAPADDLPRGLRAGHGEPAGRASASASTSAGAWTGWSPPSLIHSAASGVRRRGGGPSGRPRSSARPSRP